MEALESFFLAILRCNRDCITSNSCSRSYGSFLILVLQDWTQGTGDHASLRPRPVPRARYSYPQASYRSREHTGCSGRLLCSAGTTDEVCTSGSRESCEILFQPSCGPCWYCLQASMQVPVRGGNTLCATCMRTVRGCCPKAAKLS